MIIDFHTHIFPDNMAEKTVGMLAQKAGFPSYLSGKSSSLIASMDQCGIDKSVLLPALTSPRHFDTVNRYTLEVAESSGGRFIAFGGIHPENDDLEEKIEFLAKSGFYGIKLHPDYQMTFIDDEKYIRIITAAIKNGLAVTIHSGLDCGLPDPIHCTPERAYKMLDKVFAHTEGSERKIILAHMGAYAMGKDVLDILCGAPIYFDTGFTLFEKDLEMTIEIIKNHGADKILFATDSPWAPQKEYLDTVRNIGLSIEDTKKILGLNGARLLKIAIP